MNDLPRITVYTTILCGYCARARKTLRDLGLAFDDVDVSGDPGAREAMASRAGGARTVPQIFIGEVHVGGSDDLERAVATGEIKALLGRNG